LYQKGKKETIDGGASIVVPIMYAKNATAAFYSLYDTINVTPQEGMTAAQLGLVKRISKIVANFVNLLYNVKGATI
jgi:hypothetical protein